MVLLSGWSQAAAWVATGRGVYGLVRLRRPVRADGPYGFSRQVSRIGLAVDDEAAFLAAVRERTG